MSVWTWKPPSDGVFNPDVFVQLFPAQSTALNTRSSTPAMKTNISFDYLIAMLFHESLVIAKLGFGESKVHRESNRCSQNFAS